MTTDFTELEAAERAACDVDDAVEAAVRTVVALGVVRLDGLVRAATTAVRDCAPSFLALPTAAAGDWAVSVERIVRMLLVCIREGRPPAGAELVSIATIAAQRSQDHVPRDELIDALRICRSAVYSQLLEDVARESRWPLERALRAAATVATRLDAYMSVVEAAVDEGYEEDALRRLLGAGHRAEAVLANRLLDGRWQLEDQVRIDGDLAGKPLGRAHAVVVLVPESKAHASLVPAARRLADAGPARLLFAPPRWSPAPHIAAIATGNSVEQVLEATSRVRGSALDRAADESRLIAIVTPPVDSLLDVPPLYRVVESNLGFLSAAQTGPGVITSRRLEVFGIVAGDGNDIGRVTRVVTQAFDGITREANADLLIAVLRAYWNLSGGSRWGEVARVVGYHRNSLMPHVRKIERLLDLRFDTPADIHELGTLLRLREYLQAGFDHLDSAL